MRRSLLVLALSALAACQAAPARVPYTTSVAHSPVLDDAQRVGDCDPAEHHVLHLADGRAAPILFCN